MPGKTTNRTFQLIEDPDRLDDVSSIGKGLNDVVLHGAHHTEPGLMTYHRNRHYSVSIENMSLDIAEK